MPREAGVAKVTSFSPNSTRPSSGTSSPARMRSKVVLPDPEGPSSATNSPSPTVSQTPFRAAKAEKLLETRSTSIDMSETRRELAAVPPLERGLERKCDEGEEGEERSNGEGGDKVIVIVKCLNLQRHGVGLAADVTGNDAYCAKLAHGPGVAQQHPVEQAKTDVGHGDMPECLPARRAQRDRRFLFAAALRGHQRDQLAGDEGEGDEDGGENQPGEREDDADVALLQPFAEPALGAEQQDEDQSRDDRRHRERQLDEGDQRRLAAEIELGDGPGGGDAEDGVERHGNRRDQQRQADGRARVGLVDRRQPRLPSLA